MSDYLIQHALLNSWYTPNQDNATTFQMTRCSPDGGSITQCKFQRQTVRLPEAQKYYHCFVLGAIKPYFLKMNTLKEVWFNLQDFGNQKNILVQIYNNLGMQYPIGYCWYSVTKDNCLVVAIESLRIPGINIFSQNVNSFENNQLWLRVYANAYFQSDENNANDFVDELVTSTYYIATNSDRFTVQADYNSKNSKTHGSVLCYRNGYLVDNLTAAQTQIGDYCVLVYDSSVIERVSLNVRDLHGFDSVLDNARKYLIHYLTSRDRYLDVRFYDDVDFYIRHRTGVNHNGLLFPMLTDSAVRMVTHRDYALSAQLVNSYADYFTNLGVATTLDDLTVHIVLRSSGYKREIYHEASDFRLMYTAMRNLEQFQSRQPTLVWSSLRNTDDFDLWSAPTLEQSATLQLMTQNLPGNGTGYKNQGITKALVTQAYGYNAISLVTGDSFQTPTMIAGALTVVLPQAYHVNSTVYEYDSGGRLLGWHPHDSGYSYRCVNPACTVVELLVGQGNSITSDVYGTNNIPVPDYDDYRVYLGLLNASGVPQQWSDITGDTTKYLVQGTTGNRVIQWLNHPSTAYKVLVRTAGRFLAYDFDLVSSDGELTFDLSQDFMIGGAPANTIMQVPAGELELFINGRPMIEDLDYYLSFPKVVICNRRFLVNPDTQTQKIHVRFTGFCNDQLEHNKPEEVGFVKYGMLSRDGNYRTRNDRNLRIVLNGSIKRKSDVMFTEDVFTNNTSGSITNGLPYSIRDIVVPVKPYTDQDTYALRDAAIARDTGISNYLEQFIPEPSEDQQLSIPFKYEVFSPFVNRILMLILNQNFNEVAIQGIYSDSELRDMCAPFQYLLDNDPISINKDTDFNFVEIRPHFFDNVVTLQPYQLSCITRIVGLFARDKIFPSAFFNLNVSS